MIIFCVAPLISFLIGWLVLITFISRTPRSILWDIFLSLGLGLGISAQITFYCFLLAQQFNPTLILSANLTMILLLLIINRPKLTEGLRTIVFHRQDIGVGLFVLVAFPFIYTIASSQPFGQWDAWAVWNMKTKFLILGGPTWTDIFKLHWHTQPDYPLLLPLINAWAFTIPQKYPVFIPGLTSMLFTISCVGLLYAGLARYIPSRIAFLSAISLLILPLFHLRGTSQYADIVLAYYLLAAIILLTMTLREKQSGSAALLGITLGLMCFTKNEGMIISIILITLLCVNFRRDHPLLKSFFLGLSLTIAPTLILKFYLAPHNRDMGLFLIQAEYKFLNMDGLHLILQQLGNLILDRQFTLIWMFLILLFFLQPQRYFHKETKYITLFFILYLLCIFMIYLTTIHFDLEWRLSRTLGRIFLMLLPSVFFLTFYAYWRKDD